MKSNKKTKKRCSFPTRRNIKGPWCSNQRCAGHRTGQDAMEVAVEPPQEASPFIGGGKAGYCRVGKRGCRICAALPTHHPTAGEYFRPYAQRSPSEAET